MPKNSILLYFRSGSSNVPFYTTTSQAAYVGK